ncbi:hypothetical protein B0H12DRAFT_1112834 [Mycena haematopus]|nr:hypothetical protein B0H12DRAFT_1112834 [Mycena haematopus]
MILLESKDIQNAETTVTAATAVPDDPPPAYADFSSPVASGSGSRPSARPTDVNQTGARPTNFLSLTRSNGPINGSYTIDPRVRIPPALLPEASEPRRNLYLETTSAPIDVDIFVLGDATSKVDIQLEANGPITARIHAASEGLRPLIHITARSDRPVTVALPQGFRGPLSMRTPHCAPRLPADVTIFTEVQDTQRGFVGDFSDWTEESMGDSLTLTSTGGTVTVQCDGEAASAQAANVLPPTWNPISWMHMGAARRGLHSLGALPHVPGPSYPLPRPGVGFPGSLPQWPPGPIHPLHWADIGRSSRMPPPPGPPNPMHWRGGFPGSPPQDMNGSLPPRTPGPSHVPRDEFPGGFDFHRGPDLSGLDRGLGTLQGELHNLERNLGTLDSTLEHNLGTLDSNLGNLDLNLGNFDGDGDVNNVGSNPNDLDRTPSLGRPRRLRSRSRPLRARAAWARGAALETGQNT